MAKRKATNKKRKRKRKKKHAGGRPTKFNKGLVKKAEQYLIDYKKEEPVPTIEGLSLYLEIHRDSIYEYEKKNKKFSDIVRVVRTLQAKRLLAGGLLNKFNSIITRLMLAKHGYKEQKEVDVHSEEIAEIAKAIKKLASQK